MDPLHSYRVGDTPIRHNGQRHPPGAEITLSATDAQALARWISPAGGARDAGTTSTATAAPPTAAAKTKATKE